MKSSKHILEGIILVMIIGFASSVFAQMTPTQPSTQPPILRKSDPNQKLRELRAAEDRKRVSRQQAIKAEITKLVQKEKEMTRTKTKVEICTSPKISYVYSKEVYPGESIFIGGCGFGISKGMVAISPLNRQLEIETWGDRVITGKIPLDITGFADPKTITLKVVNIQGQASAPYAGLTLKPNPEIQQLNFVFGQQILATTCAQNHETAGSTLLLVEHANDGGQQCQGIDTVFQGMQLHNNWVFHFFSLSKECVFVPDLGGIIGCDGYGSWANVVQSMSLLIGRSTIPKIEVNWGVGPKPNGVTLLCLYYYFQMFVSGPAGTSYK